MNKKQEVDRQIKAIMRGVVQVFSEDELRKKIERSLEQNKPLRVKLGLDPSSADIHLGNGVPLRKLRAFQELGHQAVLIIGDMTGMVGDPSERNVTRPMLTREQIEKNVQTYVSQADRIVDVERLELRYNSEWFSKMTFEDVIRLTAKVTVAQMLERDYFEKRYKAGTPIGIHEFLYPLMQGWDSVVLEADVELGGLDQTFNLLMGRDLMRGQGMEPQVCLTMPLLLGLDGVNKMSKSLGNAIGVTDEPDSMFGKAMSIPDELMRNYFELATGMPEEKIEELLAEGAHPRDAKAALAGQIVRQFWGDAAAIAASAAFDAKFREDKIPDDIPEYEIRADELKDGCIWAVKLLTGPKLANSSSDARRKISQGAVTLFADGVTPKKLADPGADVPVVDGMILKVGKKKDYIRIRVK